jgi:hypothetical protein
MPAIPACDPPRELQFNCDRDRAARKVAVMNRAGRVMVAVLLVFGACASRDEDGRAPTKKCEQLRDHLVDLRLADAAGVDREAHRKVMRQAMGDEFIASCTSSLSSAQVKCALAAGDLKSAESCSSVR